MPEESPKNGLIRLKIISPMEEIFNAEVKNVLVPTHQGDILILPNRAPLFVLLQQGKLQATLEDGSLETFYISKGISEIRRNLCPILAWGINTKNVLKEEIEKLLETEKEKLSLNKHLYSFSETSIRIDFLTMIYQDLA